MTEFNWVESPPWGVCTTCGTSADPKGFVDVIAETAIRDGAGGDIVGVVDVVFCATCIEQIGNRVGMASRKETEEFAYKQLELEQQVEKLKDEVQAERELREQISDFIVFKNEREEKESAL